MRKKDIVERIENNEALVLIYEQLNGAAAEVLRGSQNADLARAQQVYDNAQKALNAERARVGW